mgnify:CR=1 FL=1
MIASCQVDLVDGPVLLAPLCKLDESILFRNIRYRANDRVT